MRIILLEKGGLDYALFRVSLTEAEFSRLLAARKVNPRHGIVTHTDELNKIVYSVHVEE